MTKQEYLIQCLSEEASEVAQAASKCLRFGLDNEWPGYNGTALDRMLEEVYDFLAVFEMIEKEISGADVPYDRAIKMMCAKKNKVASMMEYSRARGVLKDE